MQVPLNACANTRTLDAIAWVLNFAGYAILPDFTVRNAYSAFSDYSGNVQSAGSDDTDDWE
jgi:hypothetical protein